MKSKHSSNSNDELIWSQCDNEADRQWLEDLLSDICLSICNVNSLCYNLIYIQSRINNQCSLRTVQHTMNACLYWTTKCHCTNQIRRAVMRCCQCSSSTIHSSSNQETEMLKVRRESWWRWSRIAGTWLNSGKRLTGSKRTTTTTSSVCSRRPSMPCTCSSWSRCSASVISIVISRC